MNKKTCADASVVLGTRNQGKIRELAILFAPFKLTVLGLADFPFVGEVEENGSSFAENALIKASTVSKATGLVAVADDSGLEVDALGGEPGIYSARYSEQPDLPATDARNLEKVLARLQGVPQEKRTARFYCCMAACTPMGESILAHGVWDGILTERLMGNNGFGYDPIFFDVKRERTAAQMSPEEKNSCSHRAKAVFELLQQWPSFWRAWINSNKIKKS